MAKDILKVATVNVIKIPLILKQRKRVFAVATEPQNMHSILSLCEWRASRRQDGGVHGRGRLVQAEKVLHSTGVQVQNETIGYVKVKQSEMASILRESADVHKLIFRGQA